MNDLCKANLAVATAFFWGGVFALLAFDGVVYRLLGNQYTVSHGMYVLGLEHEWLPTTFVIVGCGAVLFLAYHFWWS